MNGTQTQNKGQLPALAMSLRHLWLAYGGWKGFLGSPYLLASFVATLAINYFRAEGWLWYKTCLGIHPNLLGFSLGGYVVLLAFGDGRFLDALRGPEPDGGHSPYLKTSASLAWFVLSQIFAIIVALFFEATTMPTRPGGFLDCWQQVGMFLGCWLFIYSLLLSIAATLAIFFLSRMYDLLPPEQH